MKKKVTALMAAAMMVTVGGVYATWTYASESANIMDAEAELVYRLANSENTGSVGTYKVSTNAKLLIDQTGGSDTATYHKAVLNITTDNVGEAPYVKLAFKPSVSATADVKENGVVSAYYLKFKRSGGVETSPQCYVKDGDIVASTTENAVATDIFTLNPYGWNNKITINPVDSTEAGAKWVWDDAGWTDDNGNTSGAFVYVLDKAALESAIQLNDFVLDTMEEYTTFGNCLAGTISVHLTDGTTDPTT
ncbi:MAG: hypothetical protein IJV83_04865 [Clostridia bacterium]|nr:hypothetical protein [Clostridia bacterium]